jgi:hypothetical protein
MLKILFIANLTFRGERRPAQLRTASHPDETASYIDDEGGFGKDISSGNLNATHEVLGIA